MEFNINLILNASIKFKFVTFPKVFFDDVVHFARETVRVVVNCFKSTELLLSVAEENKNLNLVS